MADLIQQTPLDFSTVQGAAAEASILARRLSGAMQGPFGEIEARQALEILLRRIANIKGALVSLPNVAAFDTLSSETWNRFVEDLSVDMGTLYDLVMTIEATNRSMEVVSKSDFSKVKAAILKAINQLRVYQFLKENPQYQDMKIVDFLRGINETGKRPRAVIDQDVRMLELPHRFRRVISTPRAGSRRATVETRVIGARVMGGLEEDFPAVNMIDADPKSYWIQVGTADGPVMQTYEASWGPRSSKGAIFEVIIRLSHSSLMNNLKVLPFFEHAYNIVDVAYLESPSSTIWLTLPGFSIRNAVEDWQEFDFPYISASAIRISIEQPNYIRTVSLVPESVLRRNQLWSHLRGKEYIRSLHEIDLTTKQEGLVAVEPEQLAYLSALDQMDSALSGASYSGERRTEYKDYATYINAAGEVAEKIVPGAAAAVREQVTGEKKAEADPVRQIVSYDYLAGIRSVQINDIQYEPIAYYESGEFVSAGTVIEASLDVDEVHYDFFEDDNRIKYRRTSIEYDLEVSPNTRLPIVPVSWKEGPSYVVRDEYLDLRDTVPGIVPVLHRGRLRFTPDGNGFTLRKNGVRVTSDKVTMNGREIRVLDADPSSIYTITYAVDEDATKAAIDGTLTSTRLLKPEEFKGTDRDDKITLKYYPYTIYDIVRARSFWRQVPGEARWNWAPEFYPLSEGRIALVNASKTITLTKDNVNDRDFDDVPFSRFSGTSDLKVWIQETGEILDVDPDGTVSSTTCDLVSAYAGDSIASSRFILGRTIEYDGRVFGLNIDFYEPIEVKVDGVRAINRTDYYTGERPVLDPRKEGESRYEYIQYGKNLYFNGPVEGKKITVSYCWLTQYMKLVATLRCNVPVATIFTPKIDSARIRLKTTDL